MGEVVLDAQREVSTDGAGGGVEGIGGAHHGPDRLDRVLALDRQGDDRRAREVSDDAGEEGALAVLGIVLFRDLEFGELELKADDREAALFDPSANLADEPSLHAARLDKDEGGFNCHRLPGYRSGLAGTLRRMRYRGYLFDLDGTLYRGEEPIPGAVEKVRELHESGAIVRYVTNNSTQTRAHFAQKLTSMGFLCNVDEVVSSAVGTAHYLAEHGLTTAFVVGEPGLVATLAEFGIRSVVDEAPAAVVVGLCRQFTYDLMNEAMQRIRAGAVFVATNPDATFPREGGALTPGAGSVVAAIRTCSETEPIVIGKPHPFLITETLLSAGLSPHEALVVGDRIDTDIASGAAAGCDTFLVLTGIERELPAGQIGGVDLSSLP